MTRGIDTSSPWWAKGSLSIPWDAPQEYWDHCNSIEAKGGKVDRQARQILIKEESLLVDLQHLILTLNRANVSMIVILEKAFLWPFPLAFCRNIWARSHACRILYMYIYIFFLGHGIYIANSWSEVEAKSGAKKCLGFKQVLKGFLLAPFLRHQRLRLRQLCHPRPRR